MGIVEEKSLVNLWKGCCGWWWFCGHAIWFCISILSPIFLTSRVNQCMGWIGEEIEKFLVKLSLLSKSLFEQARVEDHGKCARVQFVGIYNVVPFWGSFKDPEPCSSVQPIMVGKEGFNQAHSDLVFQDALQVSKAQCCSLGRRCWGLVGDDWWWWGFVNQTTSLWAGPQQLLWALCLCRFLNTRHLSLGVGQQHLRIAHHPVCPMVSICHLSYLMVNGLKQIFVGKIYNQYV
jgi:hypothetical protein